MGGQVQDAVTRRFRLEAVLARLRAEVGRAALRPVERGDQPYLPLGLGEGPEVGHQRDCRSARPSPRTRPCPSRAAFGGHRSRPAQALPQHRQRRRIRDGGRLDRGSGPRASWSAWNGTSHSGPSGTITRCVLPSSRARGRARAAARRAAGRLRRRRGRGRPAAPETGGRGRQPAAAGAQRVAIQLRTPSSRRVSTKRYESPSVTAYSSRPPPSVREEPLRLGERNGAAPPRCICRSGCLA